MANPTETQPGNGENTVQKAQEQIQKEINEAKRTGTEKELAQKLIQELKDTKSKAELVAQEVKATGTNTHLEEEKKATETLVRVIAAVKAGIPIIENKPRAKQIIQELATKDLKDSTAAAIQAHLGEYLLGQKEIELSSGTGTKTDFEKDLENLKQTYPPAADVVVNALADRATEFGRTGKDIRDQYGVAEPPPPPEEPREDEENESPENRSRRPLQTDEKLEGVRADELHNTLIDTARTLPSSADYASDYNQYYSRYFSSLEDKNILASLYNPHAFITYVKSKKEFVTKEFERLGKSITGDAADEKIGEEVSKEIRQDMSSLLDRIFVRLRRERAQKPFDEIARDDFYHGISVTLTTLNSRLDTLALALDGIEKKEGIKIKLYKEAEAQPLAEEVEVGKVDGKPVMKTRIRIKPLSISKEVNLSDFVKESLRLVTSEAAHIRQYLHDGRTIYYHPADPEKGFYSGLGRYSEDLQGADVDSLFNLPDGQLIQNAYQMYSKFLFQQFAKQDWRHEPDQFINQLGSRYSLMEQEVIDKVRMLYPTLSRERVENAVHMGVGMSRAIFLNEPEMAAFADPVLDEIGGGTGTSYYTNDTSALSPLNPLHWFMRWQGEQQIYPFLFAPVDALGGAGLGGGWDHKKVMELGKKYAESYWKGRKELGGRRLFIDEMINMARAGGPIQRKGWRQFFANEGNFIFEPNSTNLDALKTWKALENVGYEVMYDLVSSFGGRFPPELMRASNDKDAAGKTWAQKRTEFFQYLYDKYFDTSQGTLGDYLKRIRNEGAHETALQRIRKGEASPNNVNEEIEKEVSDIFMYRVLSRMVAQRIPTRLIQDDRDRFSEKGVSRYKEIRSELKMSIDEFDKFMKNIGLAEGMLRKQASEDIRNLIAEKKATDLKDINMSKIGYKLDEAKLKKYLDQIEDPETHAKMDEKEIHETIRVFRLIEQKFSGNELFLNKYAKKIKDNSYIGGATVGSLNESPFSLAIDELDLSLMAFRGTGPRIIPRAIGDIGIMERALWINGLRQLKDNLTEVATNGKKDFSPLIKMLQNIKEAHGEVQGHNPQSYETIHKLAIGIIAYYKKDTMSKGFLGLLRIGKPGSMAAEMAGGRPAAVWEWDAVDIDNFIVALETKRLLPRDRYDPSKPIKNEAIWINNPFTGKPFKLPLFSRRHKDYPIAFSDRLRREHGGKWYNIVFDYTVKYGPLFAAFLLFKFIKDAIEEAQGTKKK